MHAQVAELLRAVASASSWHAFNTKFKLERVPESRGLRAKAKPLLTTAQLGLGPPSADGQLLLDVGAEAGGRGRGRSRGRGSRGGRGGERSLSGERGRGRGVKREWEDGGLANLTGGDPLQASPAPLHPSMWPCAPRPSLA